MNFVSIIIIIFIGLLLVSLAILIGLLLRILIGVIKNSSGIVKLSINQGYGIDAYLNAQLPDLGNDNIDSRLNGSAASITKDGKTYIRPESSPLYNMF